MSVYILGGVRTPIGSFLGSLASLPAPQLGAVAIEGALIKAKIDKSQVDEIFMGNVLTSGVGQAPARQAALFAGLGNNVPATTVGKVCGSGLQAVILGARSILTGENKIVISGGMESMSLAPHLLLNSRSGTKYGGIEMKDSMAHDGLTDAYKNVAMGVCAEECTKKFNLSREVQDQFAISSFKKAQVSSKEGIFREEITPVKISSKSGTLEVTEDEGPFKANFEKIPNLKPAFDKNGTITAANASTINDGAAAIVLADESFAHQAEFKILGWASHAQEPTWFTTAPVEAIKKSLAKTGLALEQIDLFEINEAFAAVTLAAIKELEIPVEKVNVFGGAIALGHPIGASGARILVTLMNAMRSGKARFGCAAICIGGGEALSLIIERIK
jgi:acetyl-CoA C-acetyltransferase